MVTIDIKKILGAGIAITEDKWPVFLSESCRRYLRFVDDFNSDCTGCLAKELIDMVISLVESQEISDHTQAVIEIALGLYIIHTGALPSYGDIDIDLIEISEAYPHDEGEGEAQGEDEPKPSLNDVFNQFKD